MSLRTRFIALQLLLMSALTIGLLAVRHSESRRVDAAIADIETDRSDMLANMIELKAGPMTTLVYDYSYWDDMVAFVSEPDSGWAAENIEATVDAFRLSAIWICRLDLQPVYVASRYPSDPTPSLPFPASDSLRLFKDGYFKSFFAAVGNAVSEIRVAPIQPGSDTERKTAPIGYMVAAVQCDSAYFAEIGRYVGGRITISTAYDPTIHETEEHLRSLIHSSYTLKYFDGTPVGVVRAATESSLLGALKQAVRRLTIILTVFGLVVTIVAWTSLHRWVVRPMRMITDALAAENAEAVKPLVTTKSELGHIARLIDQFFQQKKKLVQEVFDRSLAEEALNRNVKRYVDLYNNTPAMLYSVDSKGRIISVSDYWLQVMGYERSEVIGRNCSDFFTEESRKYAVEKAFPEFLRTGYCSDREYQIVKRNGEIMDTLLSAFAERDADGMMTRSLSVLTDVTALKKAEENSRQLMLQLQKAQRTEALSVLAGGVAHDLNNVLGPLVAYPEIMLEQLPGDFPKRRELEIMGKSATQAAGIIRDLLTLARRGRYNMEPTDINKVVRDYLDSVSYRSLAMSHPGVEIRQELAIELPKVSGSDTHLTQVIMNLVVNAFDAMPNGGTLTIKTHVIEGGHLTDRGSEVLAGDFVVLQVTDTGAGIAEADLDKIFEPYYSKKNLGQSSGSGLGLSVVSGVVRDHNGICDVQSAIGNGTTFQIFIPIMSTSPDKQAPDDSAYRGSESILIVDDVPEQLRLATALLGSLGYNVSTAADGKSAIHAISRKMYDVCIIDMILQHGMDGLDTYRAILEINPNQRAVVVSGFAPTERVQEMLRIGAGAYVQKPYRRIDIARAIRQVIDSGAAQKIHALKT